MAIPITFTPFHHVAAAVALAALSATGAQAQGVVNALCSTDAPWCEAAAKEFTRQTGIKVFQTHKATGEAQAQLRGEAVSGLVRLGVPDELASMVEELITNSYMNAEVIRVDGGIRMPPK